MTWAIVPAAGHSRRMGRPKLTLPVGDRSILQTVIEALRAGGVQRVLVVVGPHLPELHALAISAGAEVLMLAEPTPDMRTTVQAGLDAIGTDRTGSGWLLTPADHAALTANAVRQVIPATPVVETIRVPTFEGKRGHPVWFAWSLLPTLRELPTDQGINQLLRRHPEQVREITVDDPGIAIDVDTPEDYQRELARRAGGKCANGSNKEESECGES